MVIGIYSITLLNSETLTVNLTDFCIFLNFGSLWILRLQHNDIAILRLASPVYFTPTISPACLPIFNFQEQYNDREAVVIGWGNLKAGIITTGNSSSLTNSNYILSLIFLFTKVAFFSDGNQPDVLQEVFVGIISNGKCYYNCSNYTII